MLEPPCELYRSQAKQTRLQALSLSSLKATGKSCLTRGERTTLSTSQHGHQQGPASKTTTIINRSKLQYRLTLNFRRRKTAKSAQECAHQNRKPAKCLKEVLNQSQNRSTGTAAKLQVISSSVCRRKRVDTMVAGRRC